MPLNKTQKAIKFFKKTWTPLTTEVNLYNYRATILTFFFACIALIIGFITLKLTYVQIETQLKELNAKAKIELKVHPINIISIGPEVTEPIDITIVPRNIGNYNAPLWEAGVFFCQKVKIKEADPNWIHGTNHEFFYKSSHHIFSEQAIFSDKKDTIGNFKIVLPGKNDIRDDKIIPLGLFTTYGERTETMYTFVYFDFSTTKWTVKYEPFVVNNGQILTDIKGCFQIDN